MPPSPQSNPSTSHHPKRRPTTSSHSRFPLPQPLATITLLSVSMDVPFHIMKACTLWPFVSGFSCLAGCFHGLPMLQRASRLCSFLGPDNAPLYGYTPFRLFMLLMDIWVISTFSTPFWRQVNWGQISYWPKVNTCLQPSNSTLGIYPREMRIHVHTNSCTRMSIVALFLMTPHWKQPRYPSTRDR